MGKNIKLVEHGDTPVSNGKGSLTTQKSFKKQLEQIEQIEKDKNAMKNELDAKEEMLKAEQDQKAMMEELLA